MSMGKKLGRFEVKSDNVCIANNKQIFGVKLLANSAVVCNCFEHPENFHFSHFP